MNAALVFCVLATLNPVLQKEDSRDEIATSNGRSLALWEALPADTLMAIAVHDLAKVDRRLTRLAGQLGVSVSPYTLAKGALEIVTGLDDTGSAAVALLRPKPGASPAGNLILLLPTPDRNAALTFLNPKPLDDGSIKVTLRGRESFAAGKGAFTVFGANLETVRRVLHGEKGLHERLMAEQRRSIAAHDVSVWLDVDVLSLNEQDTKTGPWWRRALNSNADLLSECAAIDAGAHVRPDGIALEAHLVRAKTAGTGMAGDTTESLLRGLPAERFILATGLSGSQAPARAATMTNVALTALAEFNVLDPVQAVALRESYKRITARIASASASISLLEGGPDGRIGITKVLYTREGASALLRDIEALVSVFKAGPFTDPRVNAVMSRLAYRRAAETSQGLSIDHFYVDLSDIETVDQAALVETFGQDGLRARLGVIDGQRVVITVGGGLERFELVVATVRSGNAPLAADTGIVSSAKQVAAEHSFEAYFAFDRYAELMRHIAGVMKQPLAIPEVPRLDAPIAVTIHEAAPRVTQIDAFIPIEVIIAVKDALMKGLAAQPRAAPSRPESRTAPKVNSPRGW